jgi:hypothetical protein
MNPYVQLQDERGSLEQQPIADPPQDPSTYSFWQIEYYCQFFQVDTVGLTKKLIRSLTLCKSLGDSPSELYGPFWIPTTLAFVIFLSSSLVNSIKAFLASKEYQYDFTQLSYSVVVMYTYTFMLPFVFYWVLRYYNSTIALVDLVHYYGYAQTAHLITVIVYPILPNFFFRFILVTAICAYSGLLKMMWIPVEKRVLKYLFVLAVDGIYAITLLWVLGKGSITFDFDKDGKN